ncbi:hypothetical protein ACQEU5_13600 [Marinactinospora thermotolerans]|uniref:Uncharacterized protein n=1 Tax=Marinactinospora thermotolerans DSM 45154 TaxID=1122192 RepID=A0A1T4SFX2_9ACTN|nr:hypothetical protein [Marinactinospora thermotolerans]SKA27204.1 hypothetical protein SAMN02745673_03530 [Marinactinospora thermotolerans DSM 45154]
MQRDQPGSDSGHRNQVRDEPLPTAPDDAPGTEAVRRNEELGARGAVPQPPVTPGPATAGGAPHRPERIAGDVPAADAPQDAPEVRAVRGEPEQDGADWRVADVANAVRGRPDGEVDTRPQQPATGTETP